MMGEMAVEGAMCAYIMQSPCRWGRNTWKIWIDLAEIQEILNKLNGLNLKLFLQEVWPHYTTQFLPEVWPHYTTQFKATKLLISWSYVFIFKELNSFFCQWSFSICRYLLSFLYRSFCDISYQLFASLFAVSL